MKRYEEAYNYIDAGIPTYEEIMASCMDIAEDQELRESMIDGAGSIEEYAAEIFAAVEEILEEQEAERKAELEEVQ